MRFSTLIDQPILLLGAGREGQASAKALKRQGHQAPLYVTGDTPSAVDGATWLAAEELTRTLTPETIVIRSPGFAPHHPIRHIINQIGWRQTTATRIALMEMHQARLPLIGVTGSKGKSTISTLIQRILQMSGKNAILVGNIGVPVLNELPRILEDKPIVVMELSSYQCDDLLDASIDTAVVGQLFPEHLNWHGNLHHYYAAKLNLLRHAKHRIVDVANIAPLTAQSLYPLPYPEASIEWVNRREGLHFEQGEFRNGRERLGDDREMQIPGRHNRENACLAFAAARTEGASVEGFLQALKTTPSLPYRLQNEGTHHGIEWINDSISTAPEASAAALEAFGPGGVTTLIVGGQDRGYDYAPLVDALRQQGTRFVIGLPDTGSQLATLGECFHQADTLADAVGLAIRLTPPGGRCVFSPGAPSYHQWSGFEARGEDFRTLIRMSSVVP